ncbi:efflux RND transporter permease subunit [Microbulbifer litoralis]|uniref:efflux RND transporter permease subunit n=1 Tax=Microbulbifer litoralis TaxID=2933965 RepID=UPI0020288A99|nr:efflux RND transporter permease subunit [Microbulbifer sp. GX H0434]
MNLSQLSYRYRAVVILSLILAIIHGFFSYFSLPAREDPKITIREAVVITRFPGLPAEQVENNITKALEEHIRRIGEVEEIRSTSMRGKSIIHVEIHDRYFNLGQIWDEVREKVNTAKADLPKGTQDPVINDDFGDVAVVTIALTANDFSQYEQLEIAEHVRTKLYAVEGTQRVQLLGVQPQRIYIDFSEPLISELGLEPSELVSQLQARNIMPPAGIIETGAQRFALYVSGEYQSLSELERTELKLPHRQGTVRLKDLGQVRRGYVDPVEQAAYFNGRRAIVFAVSMLDGYSVLDYGDRISRVLNQIRETLPAGYHLDVMTFQADQVADAVYGVSANVIQTLIIVLCVVVIFLGVRTGLIVGSIIPVTMLVTIAVMGLLDLSLERMSLATLIIALGLLVDNAIVIAEDFKTRLEKGASRNEALKQTGDELSIPLLSSTLTTILVFLPLMLAETVSGEYTRSISIVIAISLMSSWLLSLTVTPILCHRFLKSDKENIESDEKIDVRFSDRFFRWMSFYYEKILLAIMHHRLLFLMSMLITLVFGVGVLKAVPKKFFPDSDRSQVLVYIDFPSDIAKNELDRKIKNISVRLKNDLRLKDNIESVVSYSGFGGPRFVLSLTPIDPAPNKGFMVINVENREDVEKTIDEVKVILSKEFPEIFSRVTKMFLGPSDSSLLEVQVKGPDRETIYSSAKDVIRILNEIRGTIDVKQSWEARIPSLRINVDQNQARKTGLTSSDIVQSLNGVINGFEFSQYRDGDRVIPMVLRYEDEKRSSLEHLSSLIVYPLNRQGMGVPLNQIAELELDNGYYRIDRENLVRSITVEARNRYMTAEDLVPKVRKELSKLEKNLPPGHWIEFDGVVIDSAEGKSALQANLPFCLCLIFVLLVAQFNSIKRPLLIVATIPLVIVGVAMGLLLMQAEFGFMVLLGIYSLAGIIINNAIVLIDRIDIDRKDHSYTVYEAIVRASVRRLRPIVMSTVTTVLGFLPLILGRDPLFYGMASAMTFGLAVGTIMSLGVIPVLYSYFLANKNDSRES